MTSTTRTTRTTAQPRVGIRAAILATLAGVGALLAMPLSSAAAAVQPATNYAPHIDRSIVATQADFQGSQLATWYGPGFFGRGTACGQTLRPNTWGIAHRTLPCGTLVTLARGDRKVSVRVIDRGPFSGATIDLTARTKEYLGFTAGRVAMSTVQDYRVLPHASQSGTFAQN